MTIYSQHPSRGKTQILATYRSSTGITSSTVTSLADPALATTIVDALNRVSAAATVPVSVYDRRGRDFKHYPQKHLAALNDRSARAELLNGAHSLWYELAVLRLHQALADLDNALAAAPPPVRIAVDAELVTEERELRAALAEYQEDVEPPDTDSPRHWDFDSPFVAFEEGRDDLGDETREGLDRLETKLTRGQLEASVADLRLLITAYAQYHGESATLETESLAIFHEPFDSDGYFMTVDTPSRETRGSVWQIDISRWEPDDPEDAECGSATGQTLVTYTRSMPPTASEIADLLHRVEKEPKLLVAWAHAPVGADLAGTDFTATK
ncbi:hypothetical protein [Streptomyces mayteni]